MQCPGAGTGCELDHHHLPVLMPTFYTLHSPAFIARSRSNKFTIFTITVLSNNESVVFKLNK